MKKTKQAAPPLADGQLWKLGDSYLQIFEVGKRLIHYKMLRQPGQRAVRMHTTAIDTLADYLRTHKARLVKGKPSAG